MFFLFETWELSFFSRKINKSDEGNREKFLYVQQRSLDLKHFLHAL
jgi:hypothetical protein